MGDLYSDAKAHVRARIDGVVQIEGRKLNEGGTGIAFLDRVSEAAARLQRDICDEYRLACRIAGLECLCIDERVRDDMRYRTYADGFVMFEQHRGYWQRSFDTKIVADILAERGVRADDPVNAIRRMHGLDGLTWEI